MDRVQMPDQLARHEMEELLDGLFGRGSVASVQRRVLSMSRGQMMTVSVEIQSYWVMAALHRFFMALGKPGIARLYG